VDDFIDTNRDFVARQSLLPGSCTTSGKPESPRWLKVENWMYERRTKPIILISEWIILKTSGKPESTDH